MQARGWCIEKVSSSPRLYRKITMEPATAIGLFGRAAKPCCRQRGERRWIAVESTNRQRDHFRWQRQISFSRIWSLTPISGPMAQELKESRGRATAAGFPDLGGTGVVGLEFGHFAEALGEAFQQFSVERRLGRSERIVAPQARLADHEPDWPFAGRPSAGRCVAAEPARFPRCPRRKVPHLAGCGESAAAFGRKTLGTSSRCCRALRFVWFWPCQRLETGTRVSHCPGTAVTECYRTVSTTRRGPSSSRMPRSG